MAILLTDKDLPRCLSMAEAIDAVERALAERRAGTAVSHPRSHWPVGSSGFTVTPGGFQSMDVLGMRVYLRRATANDQLTVVWELNSRRLEGLIVGSGIGAIRTGAIGGVAYKRLAPVEMTSAAVVGGGYQSRTQLLALQVARPKLESVALYRRDPDHRRLAAQQLSEELAIPVSPVNRAVDAVRSADTVILATDSSTPALQADWLKRGAHVSSLGPKYRGRSEIGPDLFEWAEQIVCDFPEEYRRDEDFLLHGLPRENDIQDLAKVVEGPIDRPSGRNTLFLSHGLAGTEVSVAHRALTNAKKRGVGTLIPYES